MDSSDTWAQAQSDPPANAGATISGGLTGNADWRHVLQPESRQRIVHKITDTLKKHIPLSETEGLEELQQIAVRFEEKIYAGATSQADYLRKISLKMLTMESRTHQTPPVNAQMMSTTVANSNTLDPAQTHQSRSSNHGPQQSALPLINQPTVRALLMSQNLQNNVSSAGQHPSLSSIAGFTQTLSAGNQESSLQSMSGMPLNSINNGLGQLAQNDAYGNTQRQLQGRQHQQQIALQQQQQSQTAAHLQHQLSVKQQMQQNSLVQTQIPQQHQQHLLQSSQTSSAQTPLMHIPSGQQAGQPSLLTQPLALQSNSQPNRQTSQINSAQQSILQHRTSASGQQNQQIPVQQGPAQQSNITLQQQQQDLMRQPGNVSALQPSQLHAQRNSSSDIPQQRFLAPQNKNLATQTTQQMLNQQNVSLQQPQQQILGTASSGSSLQLQQRPALAQKLSEQRASIGLLQPQGHPSQNVPSQQQNFTSPYQMQTAQMQQQLPIQQQQNSLPPEMQHRVQAPAVLLPPQNAVEQQNKLIQAPKVALQESSSTSMDSINQTGHSGQADVIEEIYRKIQNLKELYFVDLRDLYHKISFKIQQLDKMLPPAKAAEQSERIKSFKLLMERLLAFLSVSKSNIQVSLKDKIPGFERQITSILLSHRNKPVQQGQELLQQNGGPGASMPQHTPQNSQMQQHDKLQKVNAQPGGLPMQSANASGMQHMPINSSVNLHVPSTQQNITNSMLGSSNLETVQGSSFNSLPQGATGSLQQNIVGTMQKSTNAASQATTTNNLPHSPMNSMQPTGSPSQPLQQPQQQLRQNQPLQHRHMQHLLPKQLSGGALQQQIYPQQKPQPSQVLPSHFHLGGEVNEVKLRQGFGMKTGITQHQFSAGQRTGFNYSQLKPGSSLQVSSPQNMQATSPLVAHLSPQTDQHGPVSSQPKTGTPLLSSNSPFVASPTPIAPSPLPGDYEKTISNSMPLPNNAAVVHQQTILSTQCQGHAVGTPGMSASPLLAEFTGGNVNQATASTQCNVSERPLDRLLKAVRSSSGSLCSAISDIGSVVSMVDRIAASAPGNGSRAAVGEDVAAMTKCRLQARNFLSQDGNTASKRMKRDTSAMPLNCLSSAGNGLDISELKSSSFSRPKQEKAEVNHALIEEIEDLNQQLVDTIVEISENDVDSVAAAFAGCEGIVINCIFSAIALSPSLKAQLACAQMNPVLPLKLLVPVNYPESSPLLLDKFVDKQSGDPDDLSTKAKVMFAITLRMLPERMSLRDIAKTWDACARKVITEYAKQSGGGTFTSCYGGWEKCVGAAA